ncbi:ATP-binding protein [Bacillus sp. DTU_2020_1000418_1_SI_GHA_SEK_038]|uniref:ATP-binding protein n=1 Tax=Bacillus sp. DTU_2020_1000418_1_SI_GHA_SEK_038 TaxID=3077585 RepID=UPI0028E272F1|nr:ATP-binding protein [Bacillus sp. DTU_2020_1000418_1_SI_GHA_SEK_038]WNS75413.1 ATP-binding protein [Bacillus sp. DTU_2020_1000418_1_SI_GHA_SEK_038]
MIEYQLKFRTEEEFWELRDSVQEDIQAILSEESFLMEIAINEAVNNALRSNGSEKPITLKVRVTPGKRLIVRVKDNGEGFNALEALKKISYSPNLAFEERLYEESGRGLSIMNAASDKLYFNQKGNEILLMKFVRAKGTEQISSSKDEVFC